MIGTDLKLERTRHGVRQYRLAQTLGVPSTTIWAIESNRKPVPLDLAAVITETIRALAAEVSPRPTYDAAGDDAT